VSCSSSARRAVLAAAAVLGTGAAAVPAAAVAAPPRVEALVVTRDGGIAAAGPVRVPAATVGTGDRRCRAGEGTPLAALAALRRVGGPSFRVTGDCGSLYVSRIGRQGETRLGGWVYKVGRRLPSVGAADPSARVAAAPASRGSSASGRRVPAHAGGPARRARVAPGAALTVRVGAYDDRGRGVAAAASRSRSATRSRRPAATAGPSCRRRRRAGARPSPPARAGSSPPRRSRSWSGPDP
jgi:hypothetical protein